MKRHWYKLISLLMSIIICVCGVGMARALDSDDEKRIYDALNLPNQGLLVQTISETMAPGIFEVRLVDGPIIYTTSDGRYFFSGDIF